MGSAKERDSSAGQLLAIDGGEKVRREPLPVRRLFGEQEKKAVVELMDRAMREGSHVIGYGGAEEAAYCDAFCRFMGGGYADGVNSGSSAVYVALACLQLEPLSEVIVPPLTTPEA